MIIHTALKKHRFFLFNICSDSFTDLFSGTFCMLIAMRCLLCVMNESLNHLLNRYDELNQQQELHIVQCSKCAILNSWRHESHTSKSLTLIKEKYDQYKWMNAG